MSSATPSATRPRVALDLDPLKRMRDALARTRPRSARRGPRPDELSASWPLEAHRRRLVRDLDREIGEVEDPEAAGAED